MYKIEYDIVLNEDGRPCIDLSKDYVDKPEDKFFAMELSRYLLHGVYNNKSDSFDVDTAEKIKDCIAMLGQVSDEMASILWDGMKNKGEVNMTIFKPYHVKIPLISDLDNLPEKNIIYGDKIFDNLNDIKVLVEENMEIYIYENKTWKIRE